MIKANNNRKRKQIGLAAEMFPLFLLVVIFACECAISSFYSVAIYLAKLGAI